MSQYLAALKERMGQLADLEQAAALAHWDQQTMMPVRGAAAPGRVDGHAGADQP